MRAVGILYFQSHPNWQASIYGRKTNLIKKQSIVNIGIFMESLINPNVALLLVVHVTYIWQREKRMFNSVFDTHPVPHCLGPPCCLAGVRVLTDHIDLDSSVSTTACDPAAVLGAPGSGTLGLPHNNYYSNDCFLDTHTHYTWMIKFMCPDKIANFLCRICPNIHPCSRPWVGPSAPLHRL